MSPGRGFTRFTVTVKPGEKRTLRLAGARNLAAKALGARVLTSSAGSLNAASLIDAGASAPAADAAVGVDARALPRTAWGHATPIWWGTWSLMVIEGNRSIYGKLYRQVRSTSDDAGWAETTEQALAMTIKKLPAAGTIAQQRVTCGARLCEIVVTGRAGAPQADDSALTNALQDKPFVDVSRAMASVVPGAELVVVRDAGHSPQLENPVRWLDALERFLASVERAPAA